MDYTFTMLGGTCEFHINDRGDHQIITLDGETIVDESGELGLYESSDWQDTLSLHGAAQESAQTKVVRDHVETSLRSMLVFAVQQLREQ